MMNNILPSRRPRAITWLVLLSASILLASAGGAAAAIRYDSVRSNVMLEGVSVGGLHLGGMTFEQARFEVERRFMKPLERVMVIEANNQLYTVTPKELGFTSDALLRYKQARDLAPSISIWKRLWHRIADRPYSASYKVELSVDDSRIRDFVGKIAEKVDQTPQDAAPIFNDGRLEIIPDRPGYTLDQQAAVDNLRRAVSSTGASAYLAGEKVEPAVTSSSITDVLVVKVGENQLFHYRGENVVKVYDVATGTSRYPTPKGTFKIVNKRFRPTWVNPAKYPGGWGWSLPARIGPGPGNPLGTRALDINSPGIRIHGTYASNSIGYNVSHGCIRMHIADSEELFGRVAVGTPVIIVQSGKLRPMAIKPAAQPEPTAESDATQIPGQAPPAG